MKIGIIGGGNVGTGLTKLLSPKGHQIMLSFSKDANKLAQTAKSFGAASGTVAQAVAFGEVVVVATPWVATSDALAQAGKIAGKKIVWDCTNALKPDMSGLAVGTTTSAAEEIQKLASWARVVKAIPPFAEVMHSGNVRVGNKTPQIFTAADDAEAKRVIISLVNDLGADAVDAGPLTNARYIEAACFLLVNLAYMQSMGARIGLSLVRDL